ncbi:MAG: C4-type zinc ribbon domain-containing protein [Acidimicrobiia bacterium]|nr:C4-type zinc ribbon domain-containing protein [Acidimicrobiia bacterium]
MTDLSALLDIQTHDTATDQLQHRRASLPERDELVTIAAEEKALDAELADARTRRHDLERQERRFEDEATLIEDKATSEQAKLYSGEVNAMKELQALQAEIASLKRRQGDLEDEAIALMELIEPVDAELEVLADRATSLANRRADAEKRLAETEAEIDAKSATVLAEREQLASSLGADLLQTYEKVRADQGGVAVSRLVNGTCDGCHLGLSAVELDRVKHEPPDALVYHDECGRILVR